VNTAPPATLLLVDDEVSILSSLRRLFRLAGHYTLCAESGAEGLDILALHPVDMVISDMRMPEMDGATFLAEVRRRAPDTLRILLTGYSDIASTIAAINEGEIYRYVTKPWNDQELTLLVQEALQRRALERENTRLETLIRSQNEELRILNSALEAKVAERTAALSAALARLDTAHGQLKQSFTATVRVFAELTEAGYPGSAGHGRRVAELSRSIARRVSADEGFHQTVMLGGLLHDLGKVGLPEDLLAKPFNRLNADERSVLMRHPTRAESLLTAIPSLREAARLIRHHHENFDGTGYPDHLAGLGIPLGARIIAVANDYDGLLRGTAMLGRPMSHKETLDFMIGNRGKRYEPMLVDALVNVTTSARGEVPSTDLALKSPQLRPGMVLARDLVHVDGFLLLARDFILDEAMIQQLGKLERTEGRPFQLFIRRPLPGEGS
jgi:response regulator RpfG family c-di-GMP phosphodiesterase